MAHPFHNILSPVQFDGASYAALDLAKKIAANNDATVHLLHVVPILPAMGESHVTAHVNPREEAQVSEKLRQVANERLAGIECHVMTRAAFPPEVATAVLETASEIGADLIVLATHGRTGVARFFLGSVAEGVVRGASCPVLTVRSESA